MRTRLTSRLSLLFITFAMAMLLSPAMAFAQSSPSIQSDKADYAPGELVTLTGSGWQADESVNIFVEDDQGKTWSRNVGVSADASGNISDSFNLPDWFVATYSVKATGASGTATTSFTDGNYRFKGGPSASDVGTWTAHWRKYTTSACTTTEPDDGSSGSKSIDGTLFSTGANIGVDDNRGLKVTNLIENSATKSFSHFTIHTITNPDSVVSPTPVAGTGEYEAGGAGAIGDCIPGFREGQRVLVGHFGQNTAISDVSGSGTEGGNATLTAKLSSNNTNLSGKTIVFSLRGKLVCDTDSATPLQACPTTDSNGFATLNNVSLSGISAGGPSGTGYADAVRASFRHDATHAPSSGNGNLTVLPACTNPADPTFSGSPNGDNGWYKTVPVVQASSTTSGAVIK